MPVKYICLAKGYSLSFIAKNFGKNTITIKENDIILDSSIDMGLDPIKDDKYLSFNGVRFLCDTESFEKHFVNLAELRDKRIDEILND